MPDMRVFADFENKMTFAMLREDAKFYFSLNTNRAPSIHFVDENSATLHYSLTFPRYDPYKKIFFKKLDQLIEAGWIQWIQELQKYVFSRNVKKDEDQGPTQLTLDHLGVCFIAIMACLALACLVFILERFAGSCKN
jgi:hypothetical protein